MGELLPIKEMCNGLANRSCFQFPQFEKWTYICTNPLFDRVTKNWQVTLLDCSTVIAVCAFIATLLTGSIISCTAFAIFAVASGVGAFYMRQFSNLSDLEKTVQNLRVSKENFENIARNLTQENNRLSETNRQLQQTNVAFQATNGELRTTNGQLQTTNTGLQTTNEQLQTTNTALQATNGQLQTTNDAIRQTNSHLTDQVTQLTTTNGNLEQTNTRLTNQVTQLATTAGNLEQTNTHLTDQVTQLATTTGNLEQTNSHLTNQVTQLATTNGNLEQTNTRLTNQVTQLTSQVTQLTLQATQLRESATRIKEEIVSFQKQNLHLNNNVKGFDQSLRVLDQQILASGSLCDQIRSHLAAQQQSLGVQLDQLKEYLAELRAENRVHEKIQELGTLRDQFQQETAKLQEVQLQYTTECANFQAIHGALVTLKDQFDAAIRDAASDMRSNNQQLQNNITIQQQQSQENVNALAVERERIHQLLSRYNGQPFSLPSSSLLKPGNRLNSSHS